MALPRGAMELSAECDCGISLSYSLTIFDNRKKIMEYVNLHEGAFTKGHSHKINPHFMFLV